MRPVGFDIGPIDFVQIESWSRLRGIALKSWEVTAILKMDRERLALKDAEDSATDEGSAAPPGTVISKREMSPGLFDALFPG